MNRLSVALALALTVTGCSSGLVCGAGTHRVGDECIAGSDAGALDSGSDDAARDSGSVDASVATDSAPEIDAARICAAVSPPASDPGTVSCEGEHCSGTDTCFIDYSTGVGSCLPPGSPRLGWAGAILRHCDEAADCSPGSVCCETFVYSGSWHGTTTTCESSCTYGAPAQACHTDSECAETMHCSGYQVDPTLTVSTCHAPIGCG